MRAPAGRWRSAASPPASCSAGGSGLQRGWGQAAGSASDPTGSGWAGRWRAFLENSSPGQSPRSGIATPCPTALPVWASPHVGTFAEAAWGEAGDLRQDGEEGPQTGPLGLPALKDFEDALGHVSDLLLSVALQIKRNAGGTGTREG